jgi:alkanesulfonate monooxygenase SsuD/methylene tetrahydromethanopterin reductase-like flavin-dependent oxidoreductase (luciferase family)
MIAHPAGSLAHNGAMQHGIVLTTGDARTAVELAVEAEAAGWDGVFTWDAIAIGETEVLDPWSLLAAIAIRTERIRLGAMVFAPARRRPWTLLKAAITVDHLSRGRLVLPVGLGAQDDAGFGVVGEPTRARERAAILDEVLAVVDGLQHDEPFAFSGKYFAFEAMSLRPRPVQRPRIPVWVVGAWPHERSMRRAIRWDGLVVQGPGADEAPSNHPPALAEITAWVARERAAAGLDSPYDVVVSGSTGPDDPDAVTALRAAAHAGATWWVEADWAGVSVDALRARIAAGPVRA